MAGIIVSISLFICVILSVAAVSGYISERAGIVNIAVNGFMTFGALIYAILAGELNTSGWMQVPAVIIAALATGVFSFLHSFTCIRLKANQTISGTAMNLLSGGIALFLINVVYDKGSIGIASQFDYVGASADVTSPWHWIGILTIVSVIVVLVIYLAMRYTRWGLRLNASGENPHALAAQGVSVAKIRYQALFISGIVSGIAGAIFAQDKPSYFGTVDNYGWIAVAILIAGQWKIPLIIIASIVFGFLSGFYNVASDEIPTFIKENVPLFQALPFIISLFVLVFTSRWSNAPSALGATYEKSDR